MAKKNLVTDMLDFNNVPYNVKEGDKHVKIFPYNETTRAFLCASRTEKGFHEVKNNYHRTKKVIIELGYPFKECKKLINKYL